jgi:uncharacterized protein involved in exopolysaccharide biosynthesis
VEPGQSEDRLIDDIGTHLIVTPQNDPGDLTPIFYVRYSDYNPVRAQQICQVLTTLILNESQRSGVQESSRTYDFLLRQIDAAKARVTTIERELTKYRKKGKRLGPEEEARYRGLLEDYKQAKEVYTDVLKKVEQASVSAELENQQDEEQIYVLEPATLPQSPSFPNRTPFAAAGFAVGLALGGTVALIRKSAPA